METVKMSYMDMLIIDPCYVKSVTSKWNDKKEPRFDGLKCVKTLWEGDDGMYDVIIGTERAGIGVDSGRIWVLQAEFDVEVEVDVGFWAYALVNEKNISLDDIKLGD